ncbi:hypothetical protein EDB81DRAFT_905160 [Dactylonectria macrodidyma]|uniref:Uncharacterized protein n=1 Tax=Dactylonectria macrodidyma TaxID=307937 RepID=A0A9P9E5N9_9HYPO|nr:hypothetical protein EDB81DRAFT_905160 [Dactylonectria macrodidyma]
MTYVWLANFYGPPSVSGFIVPEDQERAGQEADESSSASTLHREAATILPQGSNHPALLIATVSTLCKTADTMEEDEITSLQRRVWVLETLLAASLKLLQGSPGREDRTVPPSRDMPSAHAEDIDCGADVVEHWVSTMSL